MKNKIPNRYAINNEQALNNLQFVLVGYILDIIMNQYPIELRNGFLDVVSILRSNSACDDCELCVTRLEVLTENALIHERIPLDIVHMLNQAKNMLKRETGSGRKFVFYEAPVERRGRPKFTISEEQLDFFGGIKYV